MRQNEVMERHRAAGIGIPGIATIGNSLLRRRARSVSPNFDVVSLCTRLVRKLRAIHGQGLAAPQIGISLRVIAVETRPGMYRPHLSRSPLYVMINPVVVTYSSSAVLCETEGCFSIPGYVGQEVPRRERVTVKYTDLSGESRRETFIGFLARVVQHEIDHLNGKLYVDRMSSMRTFSTFDNFLGLKQA